MILICSCNNECMWHFSDMNGDFCLKRLDLVILLPSKGFEFFFFSVCLGLISICTVKHSPISFLAFHWMWMCALKRLGAALRWAQHKDLGLVPLPKLQQLITDHPHLCQTSSSTGLLPTEPVKWTPAAPLLSVFEDIMILHPRLLSCSSPPFPYQYK